MDNLPTERPLRIDIGVFACNKAAVIADTLRDLLAQDATRAHDTRILVLVNGCTDETPAIVDDLAASHSVILPVHLSRGGKSRSWNSFVHTASRPDADLLIFSDADIRLPETGALSALRAALQADPKLQAVNARPVKDISALPGSRTFIERLIAASAGTANDWRKAICGQLYAMPASIARRYHLPIGLPVEDGFLHALICTDNFSAEPDPDRVDGSEAYQIYESERTLKSLIRHQTRIVIGSAINEAIFRALSSTDPAGRTALLETASTSDVWLSDFLARSLPRWPYGYVSPHFLLKRSARALSRPAALLRPRRFLTFVAGAGFDLVVYCIAQVRMARGVGAGFW